MVIGIDLRPLQGGDKYRGIGEVVKQVTDRILVLAVNDKNSDISFLFYEYDNDDDPKELLKIPGGLMFDTVKLPPAPEKKDFKRLKSEFAVLFGSPVKNSKRSDVFLQFNYEYGVPKNTRTVLFKHDIIPYIFWDKYFSSAWAHTKAIKPRTALRAAIKNYRFMRTLRRSLKNAGVIMTNSAHTKKDLEEYFRISERKLKVAPLGASLQPSKTLPQEDFRMPTKPYLLFIGGIDWWRRRAVDELVASFNNLKADGQDIQLVLGGENFKSPDEIPVEIVRNAVKKSSYSKDIITAGYIDDKTKQTLFKNAVAFVLPTRYEGFGIMILEAMLLGCPVIAYKNSSVPEVGGTYALYAKNWEDIKTHTETLLAMPDKDKKELAVKAKTHAEKFTWEVTAQIIYKELTGS